MSEVSPHRAPRVEKARARDHRREATVTRFSVRGVGAEAVSGVVKTPSPSVMLRDDHGSSRASRIAKVVRGAGNERRWVFVSIRMAEVGRTHRASLRTGRSQDLVERAALAWRKPQVLPDAAHGWREGETVRERAGSRTSSMRGWSAGDEPAGSRYDGRRSWAAVRLTLTGWGVPGSSGSQVHSPYRCSARSRQSRRQRIGRFRRPTRACLQVTTRASEAVGFR